MCDYLVMCIGWIIFDSLASKQYKSCPCSWQEKWRHSSCSIRPNHLLNWLWTSARLSRFNGYLCVRELLHWLLMNPICCVDDCMCDRIHPAPSLKLRLTPNFLDSLPALPESFSVKVCVVLFLCKKLNTLSCSLLVICFSGVWGRPGPSWRRAWQTKRKFT